MNRRITKACMPLLAVALLGACTAMPSGPSVMVLPGSGKSFDQFRADDMDCRQFASQQIGGSSVADQAADSGVRSAALGTVLGAAAGAAMGGSHGAGVGAGAGLLMGSASGAGAAQASGGTLQRRYDVGYEQCMYAKGHRVPVSGRFSGAYTGSAPQRQDSYIPPPPPGPPPPPPSRYQ